MTTPAPNSSHTALIVGGGAAGITVAASLRRRRPDLDIALIEPSEDHYYQAAFTLVGGGAYALERTRRRESTLIPEGVTWIRQAAAGFDPDNNRVELADGNHVNYRYLVVCPGLQLDWGGIDGLTEALGKNGVCSNYDPQLAAYTWDCIRAFRGGSALFTQPDMPIKCPGAPQKIAYLAADHFRRQGLLDNADLRFTLAGEAIFSVKEFQRPLEQVAERYGIEVEYRKRLVAVDGNAREAVFETTGGNGDKEQVTHRFDLLHVTPPQSAPDFIKQSPLANDTGWVDVDIHSLRHNRYSNVFALGDAAATPNSKTAAAVRLQAPVVVHNLLAALAGQTLPQEYDGYASCPLVTAHGRVILAEFIYGGKVTPSFPLDPRRERRSMWWLKKYFLPLLYWDIMLKGRHWDIPHKPRPALTAELTGNRG
ncbi:MAG: FAD/NAD(P)-binding oxidoreductase [Gammaproteobacteria bacterium]